MQICSRQTDRRWRPPILLAGLLVAGVASADTVRLHPEVATGDRTITLGEVAELDGPNAEALEGVVVADWPEVVQRSRLSLGEVRQALDVAGANWAKLSLEGPPQSHVSIVEPEVPALPEPTEEVKADPADAQANQPLDDAELTLSSLSSEQIPTLRREIASRLIASSGLPAQDVRVVFSRDADVLDAPIAGPTRLRPATTARIGAVPVVVETLGPQDRVAQRHEVLARVERRVVGLIATRSLRSDRALARDDVEVAELWLDHPTAQPLANPDAVVGVHLRSPVTKGVAIYPDHLKAEAVIRRGELVNVRVVAGGLVVRSVGVAAHNAAVGEPIKLRRQRSRETFEAIAVGPQEATIRLDEAETSHPGTTMPDAPRPDALATTVDRLQQRYHER
ncbi:MAG: flagellar basal body P-ring formation chaperone FlgA [Planctomycetota bacterium]